MNQRENQRFHLFIINADGTNERELTAPHGGRDVWPVFSPDGKRILFSRYRNNEDKGLYVLELESGVVRKITDFNVNDPEFTPDGKHVIFAGVPRVQEGGGANISIMDANGGRARELLPPIPDGIHQTRRHASFSPNGKKILYNEFEFENELKQLNNGAWAFFPIAYRTIICDSNGDNPRRLNIPTNWLIDSLVWMDNGKAALFCADEDFDIQQAFDDPEATYDIYRYDIAKKQITPLTTHPANDKFADWISDDVFSVAPEGKMSMQWGELKELLGTHREAFKAFSRSLPFFRQNQR